MADYNLSKHILDVHRWEEAAIDVVFTTQALQLYVRVARTLNPTISEENNKVLMMKHDSNRILFSLCWRHTITIFGQATIKIL